MSKTLLLADDSLTIQRVVDLTFAEEDVRVVSVGTGDLAVKWMEDERPDIVLADVGMPQPDGYALAQHVKRSARLRGVPVLLLTGAFEPLDDDKARDSACDGVLVKPFEPQHLVARVIELLARQAAAPDLDPSVAQQSVPGVLEADVLEAVEDEPLPPADAPSEPEPPALHLVELPLPQHSVDLEAFADDLSALDGSLDGIDPPQPAAEAESALPAADPALAIETVSIDWGAPMAMLDSPLATANGADSADGSATVTALEPLAPMAGEAWDLEPMPVEFTTTSADVPLVEDASDRREPVEAAASEPPQAPMPAVSLASAFAALLAAEQAHPAGGSGTLAPPMTEAAIEDVVRRVLRRVTDEMVREVVLDAAERLVKEEIEKIKAASDDSDDH